MALNLKKRWADSKALYEETVGKRKPSKDFLSFVTRASTGIESGLAAYDAAVAAHADHPGDTPYAKMDAAGTAAKQAMRKYAQVLAERTKKDKLTDPAYTKGLAVLSTDLDAMATLIDETTKTERRNAKVVAKAMESNGDQATIVALQNKNALKSFTPRGASVLKDLAAGLAKVTAKPEPALYADALLPPLRDIGNAFGPGNLKQIGLDALAKSSAYPRKAIVELAQLESGSTRPTDTKQVLATLSFIGPRMTVVKAWLVNAARG